MAKGLARRRILVVGFVVVGLIGAFVIGAYANFGDVPPSAYYYNDVNWLVARGITSGGGNYCPNDPVTRGQMAKFLHLLATRTRTDHFNCDAYAFSPGSSSVTYSIGTSGVYSDGVMGCAVHLPDGATVTKLTEVTYDTQSTSDEVCYLYRRPGSAPETNQTMGIVSSSGNSGYQTIQTTSLNYTTIDNSAYSYYAYCYTSNPGGGITTLYSALVDYTYIGIAAP